MQISLDVCIFSRFKVNCDVMSLRSFAKFKLIMSRHRNELRGHQRRRALGHGLFSLCVNPSLNMSFAHLASFSAFMFVAFAGFKGFKTTPTQLISILCPIKTSDKHGNESILQLHWSASETLSISSHYASVA